MLMTGTEYPQFNEALLGIALASSDTTPHDQIGHLLHAPPRCLHLLLHLRQQGYVDNQICNWLNIEGEFTGMLTLCFQLQTGFFMFLEWNVMLTQYCSIKHNVKSHNVKLDLMHHVMHHVFLFLVLACYKPVSSYTHHQS